MLGDEFNDLLQNGQPRVCATVTPDGVRASRSRLNELLPAREKRNVEMEGKAD
jgi:hypothetical protein